MRCVVCNWDDAHFYEMSQDPDWVGLDWLSLRQAKKVFEIGGANAIREWVSKKKWRFQLAEMYGIEIRFDNPGADDSSGGNP